MSTRDPDRTRETLLEAAFAEMHEVGFQAASLDRMLRSAGVTKGALYHHFPSKLQLGYAVLDEVIARFIRQRWVEPTARAGDAIDTIKDTIRANAEWAVTSGMLSKGCPLNNLAQEMAPLDEGFRTRIQIVLGTGRDAFAGALRRGQVDGTVRGDIDPKHMGLFIVAVLEGITGIAKSRPDADELKEILAPLFLFLDGLRAPTVHAA